MAKKATKAKSVQGGKLFKGDLPKIRKAIKSVAKEIEAGRKKAIEQIAKGQTAGPGSPAYANLAANKAALKEAEKMLAALAEARSSVADICCNNDQGCNFLVMVSTRASR